MNLQYGISNFMTTDAFIVDNPIVTISLLDNNHLPIYSYTNEYVTKFYVMAGNDHKINNATIHFSAFSSSAYNTFIFRKCRAYELIIENEWRSLPDGEKVSSRQVLTFPNMYIEYKTDGENPVPIIMQLYGDT